ncbi:restriction endonuclease subunit S [Enterobacter asburiae]
MAKYKAYPEYKDSGVEWLGGIPSHWIQSKFGYLKTILTDYTANGSFADLKSNVTYLNEPSYARLVRLTDLRHNLNNNGIWIDFKSYKFLSKSALYGGEFLLANVGANAGLFYQMPYNKGPASLAPNMFMAKFSANKVSGGFIAYTGESDSILKQLTLKATASSAQPKLNKDDFKSIFCCYPSLTEQKIICNFLNCETVLIGKLIAKQQQLIELLKEKRQAVISHAVTKGLNPDAPMKDSGVEWLGQVPNHWLMSKVRYCFLFDKGLTITKEDLQDEGIPCINYGEIHSRYGFEINPNVHNLKCVNEAYLENNKNSLLIKGDIIFADTSEDVDGSGNFSQLTTDTNIFAGYHTIIARPRDRRNYRFLAYLFDCQELRSQIKYSVKGVKVYSITQAILRGLSIWLPPNNEQEYISKLLDYQTTKIDTLIQKQLQQIELLKERRTALIAAAVTGKIDLRDWTPPASSTETSLTAEEATA